MLTDAEQFSIAIYDHMAHTRQIDWEGMDVTTHIIRLYSQLDRRTRLLDIGCGHGQLISFLPLLHITPERYLGIDASEGQIELGRSEHPGFTFEVCSLYEVGERYPEQFDAFWLTNVLMHVPRVRLTEALSSIRACLKPDALGYLTLPNAEGTTVDAYGRTINFFSSCDLNTCFGIAGFKTTFYSLRSDRIAGVLWTA